jgi:hypothetical protein
MSIGGGTKGACSFAVGDDKLTPCRLKFESSIQDHPIWTPDTAGVAFDSKAESGSNLFLQAADGAQLVFVEQSPTWDPHLLTLDGERDTAHRRRQLIRGAQSLCTSVSVGSNGCS